VKESIEKCEQEKEEMVVMMNVDETRDLKSIAEKSEQISSQQLSTNK
jgi:hypothetical protein